MSEQLVGDEEELVRAVCSPDGCDPEVGRISSQLMSGKNTSVSRSALVPLTDHWELFRKCVEKPPARKLEMIATITVSDLKKIAETHSKEYKVKPPRVIKVVVSPNDCWSPREGHAEIEGKLSQGLANAIIKQLQYYKPDNSKWRFDGEKLIPEKQPRKPLGCLFFFLQLAPLSRMLREV